MEHVFISMKKSEKNKSPATNVFIALGARHGARITIETTQAGYVNKVDLEHTSTYKPPPRPESRRNDCLNCWPTIHPGGLWKKPRL